MGSSIVSSILVDSILEPSFHLHVSLDPLSSSISGDPFPRSNLEFSWMKKRIGKKNKYWGACIQTLYIMLELSYLTIILGESTNHWTSCWENTHKWNSF